MSANVQQFVVHRIMLTNDGKLHFLPRGSCFEVSAEITSLCAQLHTTFNTKPGKGVGGFNTDQENPIKDLLPEVISGQLDFHEFSLIAGKHLLDTIVNEAMLETGFVIFNRYEYLATDYLMIAMLDTKEHVEVNQHLEISQSQHLDLSKMQIAVRIDLTQYDVQPEQNRYISFLKGRMGRKVGDFFMQFIGCEEKVDVKQQNKRLLHEVDEYLSGESLDNQEKQAHRESLAAYYKEKVDLGEQVQISDLDNVLPRQGSTEDGFSSYNASLAQPIEPTFQPDRSIMTAMKKFSGAGGGVSVSFDRNLLGERVQYDPQTDTLMIKGIPPNLKDQLTKSLKSGADE
ncbi:nucleoid-associated protein YejK [Glaciecola sp. XM2]|jgi:nucleoid-associated protein|uniref:nucleoid-associated protein YejK n=1 Tax=Glaciecola sp. XM2 TaxID=1914931 RepID=UPI001BDF566D|nr:nucleoid-associated protein YejK [Glaciecola sp. XM2]MBT1451965.1 nucleoid-associated protein YejK [Glaciecola sp. XM2]